LQQRSVEIAYGSDRDGLVWGYLFEPGKPALQVDVAAATEALGRRPQAFCWLHYTLSNTAAERSMRVALQLPEAFYSSLNERVGSTRLEQEDETLIAVIHDVLYAGSFDSESVSTVALCVTPRMIVSARLRPLRSVDRLRAAIKGGQQFRTSAELLAHLLRDQAEVLVGIVRETTARVDAVEDQVLAQRALVSRGELGAQRRSLVRLQRLLAPEPAALFRLLSRPPRWIPDADQQDLREAAEELTRAVADSAALNERVKLLQEELAALVNEQTNRTLYVLTLVTVLALPINVVAGLLGMNVGGIPLAGHQHGFFVIVALLVSATATLAWFVLRLRRGE
jgi:zinc transporter